MRMRSSILANEVTSCRRGKLDAAADADGDGDGAAAAAAAAAAADDDGCDAAALAVGARSHALLPNTSQHTQTTVSACAQR